jgi:hypothetical protein
LPANLQNAMILLGRATRLRVPQRASRPGLLAPCRLIHLMNATFAKNPHIELGWKYYGPLYPYKHPRSIELDIFPEGPNGYKRKIRLFDVLKFHLKPGIMLFPLETPAREGRRPQYTLKEINTEFGPMGVLGKSGMKTSTGRSSWEATFKHSSTTKTFETNMWQAWHVLESRMHAEIQLHQDLPLLPTKREALRNMLHRCLHLRPDVILAAMPEKSGIVIDPQTNWKKVRWVIGPGHHDGKGNVLVPKNVTERLYSRMREHMLVLKEEDKILGTPKDENLKFMINHVQGRIATNSETPEIT